MVYVEAGADVHRLLFGVDIGLAEILFARDAGFDAAIAHHPIGDRASIDLAAVVRRQVDQMVAEGVAHDIAEAAVAQRLDRPHRAMHMANVNQVVDSARLIRFPLANIHLACDIIGKQALVDLLAQRSSSEAMVGDAIAWIEEFPEMEAGLTRPEAWVGDAANRLGRYTVAMAGGTNGGHPGFREYFRAGVDTIFAMHCAEEDLAKLEIFANRYAAADAAYAHLLAAAPRSPDVRAALALFLSYRGDLEDAYTQAKRAESFDHRSAAARAALCRVLDWSGHIADAVA